MQAAEACASLGAHALGYLADGQRRGVRGEYARGGRCLVQLAEELVLDLHVLDDGLDDQIGLIGALCAAAVQLAGGRDATECGVQVRFGLAGVRLLLELLLHSSLLNENAHKKANVKSLIFLLKA